LSDYHAQRPSITSPPFDDRNTVKMVSECLDPNCARWKVSAARDVLGAQEE
jgi:hypothetical protein